MSTQDQKPGAEKKTDSSADEQMRQKIMTIRDNLRKALEEIQFEIIELKGQPGAWPMTPDNFKRLQELSNRASFDYVAKEWDQLINDMSPETYQKSQPKPPGGPSGSNRP